MQMINNLQPYVLALGLGVLAGCATTQPSTIHPEPREPLREVLRTETRRGNEATIEDIMRVLGVKQPMQIQFNLPDGYTTARFLDDDLSILVGIYAGTIDVRKREDGYFIEGYSRRYQNHDALRRVLQEADTNGDHIIPRSEVRALQRRLYEAYAQ